MKPRLTHLTGAVLAAATVIWACSDSSSSTGPTPVPTSIELNKTTVTLNAIGATDQLTAVVRDQNGNTMSGQTPTWTSSATGVATVSTSGLVTAVTNGSATVTATVGSANSNAAVTVAQTPAQVQKTAGDAQTDAVTATLTDSLKAQVNDAMGNPISGVTVNFTVSTNGGTVMPVSGTTGSDGRVATEWTFGTTAGAHTVTAQPATGTGSAAFDGTADPDVADTLALVSGGGQTQQISSALPDSVVMRVVDQYGNAVSAHQVDFSVTGGTGSVSPTTVNTDAAGLAATEWTLGPEIGGGQSISGSSVQMGTPLVNSPVSVGATALDVAPASIAVDTGDGQTGLVGFAVNVNPTVIVRDLVGTPFPGATVDFTVSMGGGGVTGGSVVTDAQGMAEVGSWILGGATGTNTLDATVQSTASTTSFTATGVNSSYDVEIRPAIGTTLSGTIAAAFTSAEAKWEQLVIGELTDIPLSVAQGSCGLDSLPAISETVDDLLIIAQVDSIDGPGSTLGFGGPCLIRTTGSLTVLGIMVFDEADTAAFAASLERIVLHEMGHVIGVGTLWDNLGFLANPSRPSSPGVDTHFTGPIANAEFDALGGNDYVTGDSVPVENTAVQGQADGHWREIELGTELMTPFLNAATDPLSRLTTASLWDLGYEVNLAGSESYTVPPAPPAFAARGGLRINLGDDIWRGPLYEVDSFGRIVRQLR
jgi:hypothetical protein